MDSQDPLGVGYGSISSSHDNLEQATPQQYEQPPPLNYGSRPSAGWDYVFTFEGNDDPNPSQSDEHIQQINNERYNILHRLRDAGFVYSQLWIPTESRVYVNIALPEDIMKEKAQTIGTRLRLKQQYGAGFLAFHIDRSHVFDNDTRASNDLPYFVSADRLMITLATLRSREQWGANINIHVLKKNRIILKAFALHTEPERSYLINNAVFNRIWDPTKRPPLQPLKEYLGSRITRYLAWLTFYARMLSGIAALSIPVTYIMFTATSPEIVAWTRLVFGIGLCFWGAYWFEYWKRRNAVLNVKWGLDDFYEDNENDLRSDFEGVPARGFYSRGGFVHLEDLDPVAQVTDGVITSTLIRRHQSQTQIPGTDIVDDEATSDVVVIGGEGDSDFRLEAPVTGLTFHDLPSFPYSSNKTLKRKIYISSAITGFFAFCVGLLSFSILYFKTEIVDLFGADSFGNFVPGIATALLISIADPLWKQGSMALTRWENHRTNQSFENSLIIKRFAFQFISNYLSLFYIAFVKPFTPADPCILDPITGKPDCMNELGSQLSSLLITRSTIQQLLEIGIPFLVFRIKSLIQSYAARRAGEALDSLERIQLLHAGAVLHDVEELHTVEESKMEPYRSTIEDYGEMVIQHGFLVLFGLAFPLAAVINLINNIIECRTDIYKMLVVQQRPDVDSSADIGGWLKILRFLSTASVMTAAGLVTITSPALQRALPNWIGDVAEKYPALSFVVFEHILLAVRGIVGHLVSDIPSSTYRILARQGYLVAKCFDEGWKPYYRGTKEKSRIDIE